jgi:hypothetical protein
MQSKRKERDSNWEAALDPNPLERLGARFENHIERRLCRAAHLGEASFIQDLGQAFLSRLSA